MKPVLFLIYIVNSGSNSSPMQHGGVYGPDCDRYAAAITGYLDARSTFGNSSVRAFCVPSKFEEE